MIHILPAFSRFLHSERGAVTVELLPVLAAGVALAFGAMAVVSGGTENVSGEMTGSLETYEVATSFDAETPAAEPEVVRISARVGPTQ